MNLPKIFVSLLVLALAIVPAYAAPIGGFKCQQEWCAPMYSGQNYQVVTNYNQYHNMSVYGYTVGATKDCAIIVDGTLIWIPEDTTQTINGANVKIRQVMNSGLATLNPFYVATGCYVCIKP